jgi:TolB-like protein/Tfp pilus assembly protein PilF
VSKQATQQHLRRTLLSAVLLLAVAVPTMILIRLRRTPEKPPAHHAVLAPERSIAVLPFENLGTSQENAFFTDGMQSEILTDLAKVADLKVISQTSVIQYRNPAKRNLREIASALGVANVLEGSVRRAANRVRVNAELIDTRNDSRLWAETYDRDLADVFAIQSEIAKAVADQLQSKLSPSEEAAMREKPTSDTVAYDLYLLALEFDRNRATSGGSRANEETKREIRLLDEVVSRDPNFVPALCLLARAHIYSYRENAPDAAIQLDMAKRTLDAAARLQPDAGQVHLTRAIIYYLGSRDYAPALTELALARRSLPNDSTVLFFIAAIERRQNNWDESTRQLEQALALDPRSAPLISELAGSDVALRRYAHAVKMLDGALAWKPLDFRLEFLRAYVDMAWKADLRRWKEVVIDESPRTADPDDLLTARLILGLKERDYHAVEQILATPGGSEYDDNGFFKPREWSQAIAARGLGDHARAKAAFEAAHNRVADAVRERPNDGKAMMVLAQIDAALGHAEDAVWEGRRAVELLPVSKDALNGYQLRTRLAGIYAQVGEPDRAFALLEKGIDQPNGPNYGSLKLDQVWDPLRKDPRFEQLVTELAAKTITDQ